MSHSCSIGSIDWRRNIHMAFIILLNPFDDSFDAEHNYNKRVKDIRARAISPDYWRGLTGKKDMKIFLIEYKSSFISGYVRNCNNKAPEKLQIFFDNLERICSEVSHPVATMCVSDILVRWPETEEVIASAFKIKRDHASRKELMDIPNALRVACNGKGVNFDTLVTEITAAIYAHNFRWALKVFRELYRGVYPKDDIGD